MVKALLDRIYSGIQQAHGDIDSTGPGGSPVYNTFLGGINPSKVRILFSEVATGSNVSISGMPAKPPTIMCVYAKYREVIPREYAHCTRPNSGTAAMWEDKTQFIFLCPYFWTFPVYPSVDSCPEVLLGGTRLSKSSIVETQMSVLFHELLHLYMGNRILEPEAYEINACTSLHPDEAAINVSNYGYYLGCMCSTLTVSLSSMIANHITP